MNAVELQQICHHYGDKTSLNDINLVIPENSYLVILGKSGSGKTTLLHVLAGLKKPSQGSLLVGGVSLDRLAPRRRPIAMVFQDPTLFPHLKIRKNLTLGLDRRTPKHQIEHAIELTQIQTLLDRFPDEISGGQRRKVAIAAAICQQAKVRLFDEPLASLDLSSQQALECDLARIHRELGGTTIHVTHDGAEAMRLADQIAVLDQGRVIQVDNPQGLYDAPASIAAANSLAATPVNQWKSVALEHSEASSPKAPPPLKWQGAQPPHRRCLLAARPEHTQPMFAEDRSADHRSGLRIGRQPVRVRRLRDRLLWASQATDTHRAVCATTSLRHYPDCPAGGAFEEVEFFVDAKHVMMFDEAGECRLDRDQS